MCLTGPHHTSFQITTCIPGTMEFSSQRTRVHNPRPKGRPRATSYWLCETKIWTKGLRCPHRCKTNPCVQQEGSGRRTRVLGHGPGSDHLTQGDSSSAQNSDKSGNSTLEQPSLPTSVSYEELKRAMSPGRKNVCMGCWILTRNLTSSLGITCNISLGSELRKEPKVDKLLNLGCGRTNLLYKEKESTCFSVACQMFGRRDWNTKKKKKRVSSLPYPSVLSG